jgi:hypothetical protein
MSVSFDKFKCLMESFFSKQAETNNVIRSVKLGNILLRIQNTALSNEICVRHENVSFCFNVRYFIKKLFIISSILLDKTMNKFMCVSLTAVRNIDVVVRPMLAPLHSLSRPQLRPLTLHCISKHWYLFRNALQRPTHIFSASTWQWFIVPTM